MEFLRSQKNWMHQALQQAGFDPGDFRPLKLRDGEHGGELLGWGHLPSRFYFVTAQGYSYEDLYANFDGGWKVVHSPGAGAQKDEEIVRDWEHVQIAFQNWLTYLRREVSQPDLWAQARDERLLLDVAASDEQENTPFSSDERRAIRDALRQVQAFLLEHHAVTQDKIDFVSRQIVYLEEASERMGRKDWLNVVFSTLLGIAATLALESQAMRSLFQLAGRLLRTILNLPLA